MNNVNNTMVGFELEFCNEDTKKVLEDDLARVMGPISWCSKQKRRIKDKEAKKPEKLKFYPFDKFTLYHDDTVEPDYGDQEPWELVTPVWDLNDGKKNLKTILHWLDEIGATTNKTSGLHFNISLPYGMEKFNDNINRMRLVKMVHERKYLKMFGREKNVYVLPHDLNFPVPRTERDRAISFRRKRYIEFRFIGGKNYHLRGNLICKIITECAEKMALFVN